ncbi:hypothetical protein [Streptomyces sp. G-G2]|uniref:hypothetical protein n=1 Tax=Streptomyces sp. G-G2 TaxID=3046201 RepID=UPI0024B9C5AD|nr:hypothetical protein [Streptomyces sp. G-G2]MDJ0381252.1 hypothetical protein [Streptomyces sp. G-G2]
MSAPLHTRPVVPVRPARRTAAGVADARLHWWVLALPALAFGLLMLLLAGSGEAHAAGPADGSALTQVTQQILRAVG